MNVIARLDFGLVYNDVVVDYFSLNSTVTLPIFKQKIR